MKLEEGHRRMAVVLKATPLTFVAHALAAACAVLVLVWCISFRGGLAWEATNKSLIFNVSTCTLYLHLPVIAVITARSVILFVSFLFCYYFFFKNKLFSCKVLS